MRNRPLILRFRAQCCFAVALFTLGCCKEGQERATSASLAPEAKGPPPIHRQATKGIGHVVSSGNGLTRMFFQYDERGRETNVEHVQDGVSRTYASTYGFPCNGNACANALPAANGTVVVAEEFPDGEKQTFTFDAGGAQQAIDTAPAGDGPQVIVKRVLRDGQGQTVLVDYGDETTTTHRYDASTLRLEEIETYRTAAPADVLQLYTYAFDPLGSVTGVVDHCNEASTGYCSASTPSTIYSASYAYDARAQLVSESRNGKTSAYGYDALGNLIDKEGVVQTYFPSGKGHATPHAVEQVGSVRYAYDHNGNLASTSGGAHNAFFVWNADNMPTSSSYGGVLTKKEFVGESLWKKIQNGETTYYLPSARIENGVYRKYFDGFAERDIDGSLKFHHSDHLGSSTLVTNASGAVVHRQAYRPFGEDVLTSPPGAFEPKYQFDSKERELDGSSFYDFGARLYDPAIGRFLSADSSDADGPNRYAFVSNNPLRYVDPTGHDKDDAFWEAASQTAIDQKNLGAMMAVSLAYSIRHPIKTASQMIEGIGITAICAIGQCSAHDLKDPRIRQDLITGGSFYLGAGIGAAVGALGTAGEVEATAGSRALATAKMPHIKEVISLARGSEDREMVAGLIRDFGGGKKGYAGMMMNLSDLFEGAEIGHARGALLVGDETQTAGWFSHVHPVGDFDFAFRSTPSSFDMFAADGKLKFVRIVTRDDEGNPIMTYTRVNKASIKAAAKRDLRQSIATGKWW